MYITTFYSFKGGVGRTMALVNAALELANRGRRVLAVDFDLEAPGLDTFEAMQPSEQVPGIIDFVSEYVASGQAPEASRFISEASDVGQRAGGLWIMPSGRPETYAANLQQIDWAHLYEEQDGYLLFEDLKEQWNRVLRPDYVLVDSRTGHTDVGGICTRQLPDAVVILFFPNEQNLRGLRRVVADIRAESGEPRNKPIELHFVMSNVPDLDDEDRILDDKIKAFQEQLVFRRAPTIVHRYDSLSLLNQVVFTKDRPKSRLAREYRALVQEIARRNWGDRDGALDYILRVGNAARPGRHESMETRDDMLRRIETSHPEDGEILFRLSELRERDGQPDLAASLVSRAIDAGYDQPDAYLERSRIRARSHDPEGAEEDALRVLESQQGVRPPMVREAISRVGSRVPDDIADSAAVRALDLDAQTWIAKTLDRSPSQMRIAVPIWLRVIHQGDLSETKLKAARNELGLAYMAIGRCSDAKGLFRSPGECIDEMAIQDAFNYGMAIWGESGTVEPDPFSRVVRLHEMGVEKDRGPNYYQCMAVAYWAVGDAVAASRNSHEAQGAVAAIGKAPEFSCWRYCRVDADRFLADLEEIDALIKGDESREPLFISPPEAEAEADL